MNLYYVTVSVLWGSPHCLSAYVAGVLAPAEGIVVRGLFGCGPFLSSFLLVKSPLPGSLISRVVLYMADIYAVVRFAESVLFKHPDGCGVAFVGIGDYISVRGSFSDFPDQ